MQFQAFGLTDKGMVRETNEDSFLADANDGIFLVADGMGGLSKGDVASRIAVDTIGKFIRHSREEDITWPIRPLDQYSLEENRFMAAISLANWNIFEEIKNDPDNEGMGATLTGIIMDGSTVITANVGDSRIYRIRDHTIEQLTDDHSLVMEEVRRGNMTKEEASSHPQKHIITRALGITETIQVDIFTFGVHAFETYLLCTDGLTDMVSDDEILPFIDSGGGKPLDKQCKDLIEAANSHGGNDNITVVLVQFF